MREKIHCDLLEIYGPDWTNLSSQHTECIASTIHAQKELFGEDPNLYGFVGTSRIGNIVGGYFVIQYLEEEFHYTKKKDRNIQYSNPFARLFFTFFTSTGKVLLQNTKFVGIPLTMSIALDLFRDSIDSVLIGCGVSRTINIELAPETTPPEDFITSFESSSRVVRLEVINPDPKSIPDNFVYYNPQRYKNEIILESHRHDYGHIKKINLETEDDDDLKMLHLRDLIYAGRPVLMKYYEELEPFTMRRQVTSKFEFHLDMAEEPLSVEQLLSVIERIRQERAIFIDTPTPKVVGPRQMPLFNPYDKLDEDNDDEVSRGN